MAKVSVIMLVYKTGQFIERAFRSILDQSFDDIEYIVVNDCTPDDSITIVKRLISEYPNRSDNVKIVEHAVNRGSAAARQTGLDNASGEYVIYFDSDDYCEPDMIEELYNTAVSSSADIVFCDYLLSYPEREIYVKQPAPANGKECAQYILEGRLHGALWNKLIRRKLYYNNGVRFTEGVNLMEDVSVTVPLCFYADKIAYLPKAFLHYVQYNSDSYTKNISDKAVGNICSVISILTCFFEKNNADKQYWIPLCCLKLSGRSMFLAGTSGQRQKELQKLYPEANKYISRHPGLPLHSKFALTMANINAFWIISTQRKAITFVKQHLFGIRNKND